ncbi:MAG: amidohydrolase family protein [Acidimicrobiia bacterium]
MATHDLLITGGRVVDIATGLDAISDVAVDGDRVTAIGNLVTEGARAATVVDARGCLVTAGLVDLHTHVFRHGADFCLDPSECGVLAGVTTAVDMGSAGAWTYPAFANLVAERSVTELYSFINVTMIGSAGGNRRGPDVFRPEFCSPEAIAAMVERDPRRIRGIKTYVESGGYSRAGRGYLDKALEAASLTGLPLYIHTGELLAVDEANRPDPSVLMPLVLDAARPGDLIGHCYSSMPDGVLGRASTPTKGLIDAVASGVRLDVGHGLNFNFAIARRMLDAGLLPTTVSSDVHGSFVGVADDSVCDFSLAGTMSKLLALGMPLADIVAATTVRPAEVLGRGDEIGTLAAGRRADITVLTIADEPWEFHDSTGDRLSTERRFVPRQVVRNGVLIECTSPLLRDVR